VDNGKAGIPQALGPLKKDVALEGATPYASLKIDGAKAYALAAESLASRGESVTPTYLMDVYFVTLPGLDTSSGVRTGDWAVTFTKGTTIEGAQVLGVDSSTGQVYEVKR